jgi:carboxylesterase
LGNLLARKNITVYAMLLPGHGTSPERLAVTKYYQWIEAVEESINMLDEEYNEIYLIGNSMGGNLALIAATKSRKIQGIVTLGTPIFFHSEKLNRYLLLPMLKRIKLFQKKIFDRDMTEINKKRVCYDTIPIKSIGHLAKVIDLSKANLKNIKIPVLVMQTENDNVISNDSGPYILKNIKSREKRLIEIPESYHVFILDKYGKEANNKVLEFITKDRK